ncbi:hypothetical protein L7F22_062852 [Adiantum nelumboides]|nr:hypothetical protein [Adiantum nelumboides]
MDENNKENRMSIDDIDFAHEDANDDTSMLVNYLVTRLHQAMGNPALQGEVQQQLHAYGILPPFQQERGLERFQGETSKRGLSMKKGVENPYQKLKQLLEGKPSSKKKGHAQHERSPSREREESESSDESMEDVAPRRRRAQRSPTPTKRKRSPHNPHHCESKRGEELQKEEGEKESPSSPSSSPSSSLDEGSRYSSQERQRRGHRRSYAAWKRSRKLKKFKEGGKNISFLTYDVGNQARDTRLEMGDAMKADGAFINQEVSITPLIGKLRLHIQGYVDKEDFIISPLKHEDVILWAPRFDRLAASIKFPERKISFKFREKDMYINAQESGSSIPLVNDQAFDKSIKSYVSTYMIFVKDSLNGVDETQVNKNGMQVDLELSNFLNQFQDVFIDDIPGELPPKRGDDDHMIELIPGSSPPNKPPYRVSQAQQEEIMRQVNELVEKGMVRPSSSPFCSPILLVQKKDGTYRMCVDYRALNRITIKNRFHVPRVEDLFDKLQGSTYFSRIDLKSSYHQISIVDEDKVKTAFRTTFGLYEYLVIPFGLTNAPVTFNRMMERNFRPHRNLTGVFFDDVIIYSKTIEEHKEHLKVILQALRDNKLYVNQKKSEFFLQEIQYLRHIISKNGIRMDPAKLEVIKDCPNPRNLHEVRSFIGMCAYYRRFIEKFSLIAGPLHDLTKKNVKYVWTEKRQQASDTLKKKLISQPVLALLDLFKPFEVQCDACGDCLGAVLLQEGHAIAYESRRLSTDEQILGIYKKELLAVLHALDSWKHYLLGTPFILRMDHQSLKYFMTQTKLSNKQMRWTKFLSRFNFHIAHIAGKHNQVADALLRRPKVNAVSIATHNDLSLMIDEYAIDPNFKDVISAIALGKKEEPFTLQDGYLLYGNRLCITRSLCEKVMFESHAPPYAGHRGIQTTMKAIETYFYWPTMKGDIQDYVSKHVVCQKTKYDRGKQPGLLQPLPIPDSPWESISMDFIFGLLKSIHGNTGIWTIVGFSKHAHFIPVKKTIKAHQMATLFISQVFKYHGLPTLIVSDRDPRMTSNFWKGLFENLGTRLNFSLAYHPMEI